MTIINYSRPCIKSESTFYTAPLIIYAITTIITKNV